MFAPLGEDNRGLTAFSVRCQVLEVGVVVTSLQLGYYKNCVIYTMYIWLTGCSGVGFENVKLMSKVCHFELLLTLMISHRVLQQTVVFIID